MKAGDRVYRKMDIIDFMRGCGIEPPKSFILTEKHLQNNAEGVFISQRKGLGSLKQTYLEMSNSIEIRYKYALQHLKEDKEKWQNKK